MVVFNLTFCASPFRDGNGRVSRLLMLLMCYHLGYEVGCISLERLIEENKERYETLEQASQGWHRNKRPVAICLFLLYLLKLASKSSRHALAKQLSHGGKDRDGPTHDRIIYGNPRLRTQRACPLVSKRWSG